MTRGRVSINSRCQNARLPSDVQLERPKDATERGRDYAATRMGAGVIVELDGIVSSVGESNALNFHAVRILGQCFYVIQVRGQYGPARLGKRESLLSR